MPIAVEYISAVDEYIFAVASKGYGSIGCCVCEIAVYDDQFTY